MSPRSLTHPPRQAGSRPLQAAELYGSSADLEIRAGEDPHERSGGALTGSLSGDKYTRHAMRVQPSSPGVGQTHL